MKLESRKSSLKRTESQKETVPNKDQKAIVECAQQLRKIGDLFNLKYILADMLAKISTDPKIK
ncbi:phorbol-12-myristate-13-acetate-induced protein 1 [Salvelinus sp. IW2-2015]|uniref:phorbol-12-myristate-13-acetate-induced protein 1 n=1 Tax=Salvelinus sp. IW2-2015 TaxID=2691554 RepID=UPI0038D4F216